MEKSYPKIFEENAIYGLQKILLDNFPQNFYIWSAIVAGACMQKVKIGHRAKFWASCFPQILFLVQAILRNLTSDMPILIHSPNAGVLVMTCVECARVQLKTLSTEPP